MKRIYIMSAVVFLFSSCLKDKLLPLEPQITTSRLEIEPTKATLYLGFTDGNGNFGLEDADTSGVFDECLRAYNLYAEYYELQNGVWTHIVIDPCDEPIPLEDDTPFYNRVPWARPTGQNQTQEGEIKVVLNDWYLPSAFDTVRFEIHIVDREMKESNRIILGPFVKQ